MLLTGVVLITRTRSAGAFTKIAPFSGEGGPGIPAFSCSTSRRAHVPVRIRGAYNADAYYHARSYVLRRPRFAISHTAEEFEGD
jgi:hypothetical protein